MASTFVWFLTVFLMNVWVRILILGFWHHLFFNTSSGGQWSCRPEKGGLQTEHQFWWAQQTAEGSICLWKESKKIRTAAGVGGWERRARPPSRGWTEVVHIF
ncbi:hypothetical protein BDA96_03G060200 [Sorghum bicolor]|uniref:Uncharacterized protein n=2 Tax=Sorghum bicolor TaxID=4558 RepID=A0A1W0VVT3_SORBI|nr:hypothetical protein BDA96_03G060200 [Sorghum bicolor]OQU86248.1 hypothetical protein SORBI_3003G056250 [Sorghum bicolor]